MNTQESPATPSLSIFRIRNYRLYWLARVMLSMAVGIESVTLGWQIYNIARLTHSVEQSAFLVGMIGLVQFVPMFFLALPAGEMVDRYDRKKILIACVGTNIACALAFTLLSLLADQILWPYFIVSAVFGMTRAFIMPLASALGPMLVERAQLPRAIAWNAIGMQIGRIIGPLAGRILCGISVTAAFAIAGLLYLVAILTGVRIKANTMPDYQGGSRLILIREGLHYVWNNKIVFGAISLDLVAVLLGGATALLPVFARDVLFADAQGFGLLRAGPFIGAAIMMLYLTRFPLQRRAGATMFIAVGIFGLSTLVFAVSRNLYLSVGALAVLGAGGCDLSLCAAKFGAANQRLSPCAGASPPSRGSLLALRTN